MGGVGGVGGDGPNGNCAWNGPGACGDKQRQGRNGLKEGNNRKTKSGKATNRKPKKDREPKQRVVGNGLWTVEQWLKHG